ncbi:MAG: type II toxin-antitoxin system HicA family toxin [Chloroflexi bacterium]|nr:type II toxin-antitoxin system HicA family toxin [Chloroflexota bacterium]
MPKQKVLSGREVCDILILNGFEKKRQKGSHITMQRRILLSTGTFTTVTVPVPNHKELKPGTLAWIIRKSGLPKSTFN